MTKVCAWCNRDLGRVATTPGTKPGRISHGICADCVQKLAPNGLSSESLVKNEAALATAASQVAAAQSKASAII